VLEENQILMVRCKGATRGRAKRAEAPSLARSKWRKKIKNFNFYSILCIQPDQNVTATQSNLPLV